MNMSTMSPIMNMLAMTKANNEHVGHDVGQ